MRRLFERISKTATSLRGISRSTVALAVAFVVITNAKRTSAENSVGFVGNYYKERSTRVISPQLRIAKELPEQSQLEATVLIDQITSASGAFTPTDEPFTEHRKEYRLSLGKTFAGFLTPTAFVRYSAEPDYDSLGFGGSLAAELFDKNTTVTIFLQKLADDIRSNTSDDFVDELSTVFLGLTVSQNLNRRTVVGGSLEAQFLDGFQENVYRVEQHPRDRKRYAIGAFASYRSMDLKTTARLSYRLYQGSWEITAHTIELRVFQTIGRAITLVPRFRYHTQGGLFFENPGPNDVFSTNDPKLTTFHSFFYGTELWWDLGFLKNSALSAFSPTSIVPSYFYLDQKNRYGAAHIAQLSMYWPWN